MIGEDGAQPVMFQQVEHYTARAGRIRRTCSRSTST